MQTVPLPDECGVLNTDDCQMSIIPTEEKDADPLKGKEGHSIKSESGSVLSEGSRVLTTNIEALAPGDVAPSQPSSVFMTPGPSPTPLKQPAVTSENNPDEIALHIQVPIQLAHTISSIESLGKL